MHKLEKRQWQDQVRMENFALIDIVLIWQSAKKEGEYFRLAKFKRKKEICTERQ